MDPTHNPEPQPQIDHDALHKAQERTRHLAAGLLALPNLFLRSLFTLGLLYGMLGLVLITCVQLELFGAGFAVALGCGLILLQFAVGPWIMDLMLRWLYKMQWVEPSQLPQHLEEFVQRVCAEHRRMRFPAFGVIDDGAPQAFTYGHHPGNARVVISRGLIQLLTPEELEAVVAHELGHAHNWDMALMTLANLVPLILYWIYDLGIRLSNRAGDNKVGNAGWIAAIGAYVLYIVSEYVVLWFSRTREYAADRFAGAVTGNPNALASALVKIAYGLAAQHSRDQEKAEGSDTKKKKTSSSNFAGSGALGALNIFDRGGAVSMVMTASSGSDAQAQVDPERVKSAMQWDLWNPWAGWYELNSTHPLVARRLLYLSDQSSSLGHPPYITFDRVKPESYWDDFLVDLGVLALPWLGLLAGLALLLGLGLGTGVWHAWLFGVSLGLLGLGGFIKSRFAYRGKIFEHRTLATLLGHVKVSPVRPVPCTVQGRIIGKGVPGLIWSEDFVIQDPTGILFLDYRQPLALWNWLFGLLRAERYQGKEVRVQGWFRRAPTPYLEIYRMEVVDGSQPPRRCYSYWAKLIGWSVLAAIGFGLAAYLFAAGVQRCARPTLRGERPVPDARRRRRNAMPIPAVEIVGLGEVLWDLLPTGKVLGGAPFNFTFHCHQLGHAAAMVSRVGADDLGREIREAMRALGLDDSWVQEDSEHPTGTVGVALDQGQPTFTIHPGAWDHLAWNDCLEGLFGQAQAICFGTLIQRQATARDTVRRALRAGRNALLVYDVNLRQDFYTPEILEESLRAARWVKLNDGELAVLRDLFGLAGTSENALVADLRKRFGPELVALTRGARGCLVQTADEEVSAAGVPVQVVDTIGAGDAFTAGLVCAVLEGREVAEAARFANRLAARVAGAAGGTPKIDRKEIEG